VPRRQEINFSLASWSNLGQLSSGGICERVHVSFRDGCWREKTIQTKETFHKCRRVLLEYNSKSIFWWAVWCSVVQLPAHLLFFLFCGDPLFLFWFLLRLDFLFLGLVAFFFLSKHNIIHGSNNQKIYRCGGGLNYWGLHGDVIHLRQTLREGNLIFLRVGLASFNGADLKGVFFFCIGLFFEWGIVIMNLR